MVAIKRSAVSKVLRASWSPVKRLEWNTALYGTVETDCGTGYVYDVIADFTASLPLR